MSPSAARFAGLTCSKCGYDIRGLPDNVCPECGVVFDPKHVRQPRKLTRTDGILATVRAAIVNPALIGMYLALSLAQIKPGCRGCCRVDVFPGDILTVSGLLLIWPLWEWSIARRAGVGGRIAGNLLLAAVTAWLTCNFMVWNQYAF